MSRIDRVDQLVESYARYDAIGNDVFLMRELIRKAGYTSEIYAKHGDDGVRALPSSLFFTRRSTEHDLVIHHFSIASNLPYLLFDFPGKRVTRYHNITPSYFFDCPEMRFAYQQCQIGRYQLSTLREATDYYLAASEFNANELQEHGMHDGAVLPVLRRYDQLHHLPVNHEWLDLLKSDGRKNILFVGRIIPNKCQHDLIMMLHQYKKHYGVHARLILVGGKDPYYGLVQLPRLLRELGLTFSYHLRNHRDAAADVLILGNVDDAGLATFYHAADVFTVLSEHEGFCVPIVEAMGFSLPILAHPVTAVPETLGSGGLLCDKNDRPKLLESLHELLQAGPLRDRMIQNADKRFRDFRWDVLEKRFTNVLKEMVV